MSAATITATPIEVAPPEDTPVHAVGLRRVIRSEWIKLRSVRSTVGTIAVAGLAVVVIGVLVSMLSSGTIGAEGEAAAAASDATFNSVFGTNIAQLILGVLGALLFTSEYATGMIRATLTAVPKRVPVLWAKAIVFGGVTFATMTVAVTVAFFVGQAVYGGAGVGASIFDPGVPLALLGAAVFPTAIAVMGIALGSLTRHTATAAGLLFGGLFLLPVLLDMLGGVAADAAQFLPSEAGAAATAVVQNTELLSPMAGFATLATWVAVLLGASAYALKRRDA